MSKSAPGRVGLHRSFCTPSTMALTVLLLATAVALRLVGGQEQSAYGLTLHFHQYSNPSSTIFDGTCCNGVFCYFECTTLLGLCFRIGGTSHDSPDCPGGYSFLGIIGGDDVTFTGAVGDSRNPLVLPVPYLPPSGYQLLIQSIHVVGPLQFYLVDDIFIEIPASTLEKPSNSTIYSGVFHEDYPVTLNLSYSLKCSPNYTLCIVNSVPQCVLEKECINGSESLSAFVPPTALVVFPDQSIDNNNIAIAPISFTFSHSSISSFVVSATPSSSFSTNVANAADAVPVVAIAGAALGVLVLALVVATLVVVGVAIAHRRKKKPRPAVGSNTYMTYSEVYRENSVHSSQPTAAALAHQQPREYEEVGGRVQGNTYEVVDDPESTMVDVANPMYHTTTLPGSREPLYEDAQGDQDRGRSDTLTEVSNPMYGTTQMQENEEPGYQETQREVENDLYKDRIDALVSEN